MYTSVTRTYIIDLEKGEADRWAHVIHKEHEAACALVDEALESVGPLPRVLMRLAGPLFGSLYKVSGGRYVGEARSWAKALGRSAGEALLVNCTYELTHAGEYYGSLWPGAAFGCTAGIRWVPGLGMVHIRSMDWPLTSIGPGTRIFRFQEGEREFVSVGIVGFLGVLSGMLPGAYSVTINWAPPVRRPGFDFGPAFLLREVLETCDTYEEAVYELKHTPLASSVFFTVCGAKKGQACVIERTRDDASVRSFRGPVLIQANHHVSRRFSDNNDAIREEDEDGASLFYSSFERAETLEQELKDAGAARTLEEVALCLDADPVCNEDSHQQMAFCPRSGEVAVWRTVNGERPAR